MRSRTLPHEFDFGASAMLEILSSPGGARKQMSARRSNFGGVLATTLQRFGGVLTAMLLHWRGAALGVVLVWQLLAVLQAELVLLTLLGVLGVLLLQAEVVLLGLPPPGPQSGAHGSRSWVNEAPSVESWSARRSSWCKRAKLTAFMHAPRLLPALNGSSMEGPTSPTPPLSPTT